MPGEEDPLLLHFFFASHSTSPSLEIWPILLIFVLYLNLFVLICARPYDIILEKLVFAVNSNGFSESADNILNKCSRNNNMSAKMGGPLIQVS